MKSICLLGATGSIGKNCIDIVRRFEEKFLIKSVAAYSNIESLFELSKQCKPDRAALVSENVATEWFARFREIGVELLVGADVLEALAGENDYDILVNAVVGAAGLKPTIAAAKNGKTIALANKETLVAGGRLVTTLVQANNARLIPIDSEHSALWQCVVGEKESDVERLILTASGGPFRELPKEEFREVTVERALRHPNWAMGKKITIDSATLMNKGLEVIEAFWLFDVTADQISVLIHPQSIIHSMVEFSDSSIKAQLGLPDMRLPIQYALTYPERLPNSLPRMDFVKFNQLTFFEPDLEKFRSLKLAFQTLQVGGTAPAVLNAANEEAVYAFLDRKIGFIQIPQLVDEALQTHQTSPTEDLETILTADAWARAYVQRRIVDFA
mgnify:CR=1 FL=1